MASARRNCACTLHAAVDARCDISEQEIVRSAASSTVILERALDNLSHGGGDALLSESLSRPELPMCIDADARAVLAHLSRASDTRPTPCPEREAIRSSQPPLSIAGLTGVDAKTNSELCDMNQACWQQTFGAGAFSMSDINSIILSDPHKLDGFYAARDLQLDAEIAAHTMLAAMFSTHGSPIDERWCVTTQGHVELFDSKDDAFSRHFEITNTPPLTLMDRYKPVAYIVPPISQRSGYMESFIENSGMDSCYNNGDPRYAGSVMVTCGTEPHTLESVTLFPCIIDSGCGYALAVNSASCLPSNFAFDCAAATSCIADGHMVKMRVGMVTLQSPGLQPAARFVAIVTGGKHNLIGARLWRELGITLVLRTSSSCQMLSETSSSSALISLLRTGTLMDPGTYVYKCRPLRVGATLTLELAGVYAIDELAFTVLASEHCFYTIASRDTGANVILYLYAQDVNPGGTALRFHFLKVVVNKFSRIVSADVKSECHGVAAAVAAALAVAVQS